MTALPAAYTYNVVTRRATNASSLMIALCVDELHDAYAATRLEDARCDVIREEPKAVRIMAVDINHERPEGTQPRVPARTVVARIATLLSMDITAV